MGIENETLIEWFIQLQTQVWFYIRCWQFKIWAKFFFRFFWYGWIELIELHSKMYFLLFFGTACKWKNFKNTKFQLLMKISEIFLNEINFHIHIWLYVLKLFHSDSARKTQHRKPNLTKSKLDNAQIMGWVRAEPLICSCIPLQMHQVSVGTSWREFFYYIIIAIHMPKKLRIGFRFHCSIAEKMNSSQITLLWLTRKTMRFSCISATVRDFSMKLLWQM